MEAPEFERRLAGIVAADVKGYSRLMHDDEEATMALLSARRATIAVLQHDITDIDADPKAHRQLRLHRIGHVHRLLNGDRARNRVEHAAEFGQHAVAGGVGDPDVRG